MDIEIINLLNISLKNYIIKMVLMPFDVLENSLLGKNYKKLEIMKNKDIDKLDSDKKNYEDLSKAIDRAYPKVYNL